MTYTYDAMGLPAGVTTKRTSLALTQAVASWVTYEPFGPVNGIGFGNGLVWYEYFDLGGFPDAFGVSNADGTGAVFRRYHTYDGVNITGLNDDLDDTQDVWMDGADGYDAANRLTKAGLTEGGVFNTHRIHLRQGRQPPYRERDAGGRFDDDADLCLHGRHEPSGDGEGGHDDAAQFWLRRRWQHHV